MDGSSVGSGEAVRVGAIVGVLVGLGVNVKPGLGDMVFVGVNVATNSVDSNSSCCSVGVGGAVACGRFRIKIDTTKTIINTIPNRPIRNNC